MIDDRNPCVARHPFGGFLGAGQVCGLPATHMAGDVEVCFLHYERLKVWAASLSPRTTEEAITEATAIYREHGELERQRAADAANLERDRVIDQAKTEAICGIVYYLLRDDGLIKIGTSRNYSNRIGNLKREHGPLKLMTAELGGYARENKMHRRFRALCVRGEWFHPELPLLKHIAGLRRHQLQAGALKPDISLEEIMAMIRVLGSDWELPDLRGPQRRSA